jgi:hypothetical protein
MFRVAIAITAGVAAASFALATAGAAKPFSVSNSAPSFSDQEILDAAYGTQKTHPGAYSEELGGDQLYYVNTVSVDGSNEWVELCANDALEAEGYAAATNANSSQVRALTSQSENDKFYEFRYEGFGVVIRMRVHKCAYAAPSADLLAGEVSEWGTFSGSLAKNGGREFAQYDWFVRHYGRYDGALIATVGGSGKFGEVYDLYHAYIALAAGPGQCDEIALARITVTIDKARSVHIAKQVVDTVEGTCQPDWGV